MYTETDLRRLGQAKRMRETGIRLQDIRYLLGLLEGNALGSEAEALRLLTGICDRISTQIALAREIAQALGIRLTRRRGQTPTP